MVVCEDLFVIKASDLFGEVIDAVKNRKIKLGEWDCVHRSNLETQTIPFVVETLNRAIKKD